ncbi:MAG: glycosyltransferase family 4 protein [Fimbriimonadaceae bacterium]|nr:glycosyltransferase family 4 protein [Chthonomonadaceae bacterium]MCO5295974.1 glycosyltransferase family 4 protein [Fimbriimonadaceae bacterium]
MADGVLGPRRVWYIVLLPESPEIMVPELKKLRILQVVSSSATSGAERHVFALSKHLRDRGHQVEVICPEGGWLSEDLRLAGIPAHVTEMKGRGWFQSVGLVMRLAKEQKIDVIHSHLTRATYFGSLGGLFRGVPAVATVHIANHDQIYKRMARGKNRLVAVSNFVRGMLHGRGIPDRFIDTVYNGTDFVGFAKSPREDVMAEFEIPDDRRVVGLVGRVCREKGHLDMIEAMRQVRSSHPDAHLVFVGRVVEDFKGQVDDAIRAADLADRVTLTGVRHDVPRLLDSFALSTMPSHIETFGIAAIEAMARGRAVVATRVGGLPEVVRHQQTGLLVDLCPGELANAVSYLLEHESERVEMGSMGRRIVEEKFTISQMVARLENVYGKAVTE